MTPMARQSSLLINEPTVSTDSLRLLANMHFGGVGLPLAEVQLIPSPFNASRIATQSLA